MSKPAPMNKDIADKLKKAIDSGVIGPKAGPKIQWSVRYKTEDGKYFRTKFDSKEEAEEAAHVGAKPPGTKEIFLEKATGASYSCTRIYPLKERT